MNKEFNTHIINQNDSPLRACFELSDFLTINIHKATILTGSCFFIVRNHREFLPKSSISDYIENKIKLGGAYNCIYDTNSFIFSVIQYMQCSTATCDLTQPKDNAAKLISSSVNNTFEMNVKGLIELMYQN